MQSKLGPLGILALEALFQHSHCSAEGGGGGVGEWGGGGIGSGGGGRKWASYRLPQEAGTVAVLAHTDYSEAFVTSQVMTFLASWVIRFHCVWPWGHQKKPSGQEEGSQGVPPPSPSSAEPCPSLWSSCRQTGLLWFQLLLAPGIWEQVTAPSFCSQSKDGSV